MCRVGHKPLLTHYPCWISDLKLSKELKEKLLGSDREGLGIGLGLGIRITGVNQPDR